MKKSELQQIIREEISNLLKEEFQGDEPEGDGLSGFRGAGQINKVINEGTPEQEKIKKVVDQYVNLRKAIDNPNYPDTPHTYAAMKKVENILQQMSKKENYRISLLKILPPQYQDFLK